MKSRLTTFALILGGFQGQLKVLSTIPLCFLTARNRNPRSSRLNPSTLVPASEQTLRTGHSCSFFDRQCIGNPFLDYEIE